MANDDRKFIAGVDLERVY